MPQMLADHWIENYAILILTLTLLTTILSIYFIPNKNSWAFCIFKINIK